MALKKQPIKKRACSPIPPPRPPAICREAASRMHVGEGVGGMELHADRSLPQSHQDWVLEALKQMSAHLMCLEE